MSGHAGTALLLAGLAGLAIVAGLVIAVGRDRRRFRALVLATTVITFGVVVLGAYVRLSDAGLGCPDWPGCYGKMTPVHAGDEIARAVQAQGGSHGPVSLPKAWKEMAHRYLAGFLGLLILAIAAIAWRARATLAQSPLLASAIMVVVIVQATLGAWTVTMLLKPAIVTGHLIGGMSTLALLVWLHARQGTTAPAGHAAGPLQMPARIGLVLLILQMVLGGWVSTNYAALACPDLPLCRGSLVPAMDFGNAFHVLRDLGRAADGALLSLEALTAIHWLHRLGAIVVVTYLAWLAWRLASAAALRTAAWTLLALVIAQFLIGLGNVLFSLQLTLATAHNAGAALLLVTLVVINSRLGLGPDRDGSTSRNPT